MKGPRKGDIVRAAVSPGKRQGYHAIRFAMRASGSVNIRTAGGAVLGFCCWHCRMV